MPEYFVDCHCHLFNVEDIPLYSTVARIESLPNSVLSLALLFGMHKSEMNNRRAFIDFFDRQRRTNTEWLANGIADAIAQFPSMGAPATIITPLVMDFDQIADSLEDVAYQTRRLRNEVFDANLPRATKVLPFVGIDLRKVSAWNDVVTEFDALLAKCGPMKSKAKRGNPALLANGDIIGVKLYPAIGFNPFADGGAINIDPKRKEFYELCNQRNIPITAHCQHSSFYGHDVDQKEADGYNHPVNWKKVLQQMEGDSLRLNFGHFGGEKEIKKAVLPDVVYEASGDKGPREEIAGESWTHVLLCLLKQYEHTYADISAFDYSDKDAVLALAWLLVLDEMDDLDRRLDLTPQPRKLKEKLLWGSDIPMILGKPKGGHVEKYMDYLKQFVRAMNIADLRSKTYDRPLKRKHTIPDPDDLIERITCKNPMRFLFGMDL